MSEKLNVSTASHRVRELTSVVRPIDEDAAIELSSAWVRLQLVVMRSLAIDEQFQQLEYFQTVLRDRIYPLLHTKTEKQSLAKVLAMVAIIENEIELLQQAVKN